MKASPPRGRWIGAALLPGLATLSRDDVAWLGDFERCMAAAMISGRRGVSGASTA